MVIILPLLMRSKCDRVAVDAVVGGAQRLLDDLEPAAFAQCPPRSRGRVGRLCLGDLLHRSVFDERTRAEAISHGKSPSLSVVAGGAGCEGRDQDPAGDLNPK